MQLVKYESLCFNIRSMTVGSLTQRYITTEHSETAAAAAAAADAVATNHGHRKSYISGVVLSRDDSGTRF